MGAAEPGAQPDYPRPPRRDAAAPHGRDESGKPLAPHGHKADGTPRVTPPGPGRGKTGANQARTQKAAPLSPAPDPGEQRARRASDARETLELLSAGGALLAMILSARHRAAYEKANAAGDKALLKKAAGGLERAQVLQLDAAACAIHADGVGAGVAEVADHNKMAAALADRLSLFNGVAAVGIAVMPLVYQLTANHAPAEVRDNLPPELLSLGVLPPRMLLEKLEAQNAVKMAQAQTAILRERQAAEAELAELREQAAAA